VGIDAVKTFRSPAQRLIADDLPWEVPPVSFTLFHFFLKKSGAKTNAQNHSRPLRGVSFPSPLLPWAATHGYSRPGSSGRNASAAACSKPRKDAPSRRVFPITSAGNCRDVPAGASAGRSQRSVSLPPPAQCRPGLTFPAGIWFDALKIKPCTGAI
jgi:hypothetical protein